MPSGFGLTPIADWFARLSGVRSFLAACLLGALGALSMAPFSFVPAVLISLTGFVWLLDGAALALSPAPTRLPWRRAAALGWWYGFGYFLAGLYWIGFAFLVDADTFAWMIPFVAVLMPGGLALFTAAATACAGQFWSPGAARLLALVVALSVVEWLRGHILTGFPWNLFGYAWGGSLEVSQAASLVGAYGLTFLTLLICVSPAAFASGGYSGPRPWRWPVLAAILVAALWGFGAWRLAAHPTEYVADAQLRLVQPSIPQAEKWKRGNGPRILDRYLELSMADGFNAITHVVWPEAAVPYRLSNRPDVVRAITSALGPHAVLLTGSVRAEYSPDNAQGPLFYNALHVIQRSDLADPSGVQATYDKFHLVPFGEYLPFISVLEPLGLKQMAYGDSSGYSAGPGPQTLAVPGLPPVSPMICYEIIFPGRTLSAEGNPAWILNVTNDAWFGDTSGPRQHLAMTQIRAIETGRPVVRSANNGISAVIDAYGRIQASLPLNAEGVLDSPLPRAAASTLYHQFGDVAFWIFLLISALSVAGSHKR